MIMIDKTEQELNTLTNNIIYKYNQNQIDKNLDELTGNDLMYVTCQIKKIIDKTNKYHKLYDMIEKKLRLKLKDLGWTVVD